MVKIFNTKPERHHNKLCDPFLAAYLGKRKRVDGLKAFM